MSIYGEIYDTRPLEKDFDWIVVYDLDLRVAYIGRGYPFACSLNISADCAEVNESLDFVVMGGVDGYIYRAYDDAFYSHGCPGPLSHWYVAETANFYALQPLSDMTTNLLTIRSQNFEVTGINNFAVQALSGITRNPATNDFWVSQGFALPGPGGGFYSFPPSPSAFIGWTGFEAVHALAVDSAGIVYGSASVAGPTTADRLITIDTGNGLGALVGLFGTYLTFNIQGMDAMTFDAENQILYGVGQLKDGANVTKGVLFTINRTTGVATFVGQLLEDPSLAAVPQTIAGITIDEFGNWIGSLGGGDGRIIAINPTTLRFSFIFDAAAGSVSDIVAFPFQALTNNVRLDVTPGVVPMAPDGLKGLFFTNLRQPGSVYAVLSRAIESHSDHELLIAEPFWVGGELPQPGDLIVIGLIEPFVDFAEQHPRYPIAVERIGFDAKSGDDDELQYTVQIFTADPNKNEVNLTAPAVERTFTEAEAVRQKQGLGLRRFPTRALRPRLTWLQLSAAMEIRRLDLDYQVYEREDSRG